MGNVPKRQQPDQRADNNRRPPIGMFFGDGERVEGLIYVRYHCPSLTAGIMKDENFKHLQIKRKA